MNQTIQIWTLHTFIWWKKKWYENVVNTDKDTDSCMIQLYELLSHDALWMTLLITTTVEYITNDLQ